MHNAAIQPLTTNRDRPMTKRNADTSDNDRWRNFATIRDRATQTAMASIAMALLAAVAVALACTVSAPTPTLVPTPQPVPTATPEPTATATTDPTSTPIPTPPPSPTPTDSATATATPAQNATATPLPTPTATQTPLPAPTASPTPMATTTPSPEPTETQTPVPTQTPIPTPTATPTPSPTPTATPIPLPSLEEQRAALAAFYAATDGDNWMNNEGWLSDRPLDEWHGVYTNWLGNVIELRLDENNLSGAIPAEIGQLESLEHLNLRGNQLTGSIPLEIGNLKRLSTLILTLNSIRGTIPPSIGELTELSTLHLNANNLSGEIPDELGNLAALSWLDLSRNQLAGNIPIWNLKMLERLHLDDNDLTGNIPNEIGQLTALFSLHLGSNKLTGNIPTELGELKMLAHLSLGNNQLTGNIPAAIGQLTALIWLDLSSNKLTGNIPTELADLSRLEHVYVRDNQFDGCIPDAWQQSEANDFNDVNITYCGFNPAFPTDRAALVELYNSTNGHEWRNNENWLSDLPLSAWYGVRVDWEGRVTHLDLRGNDLRGRLIPELGQLDRLIWLDLSFNMLSGPIPPEIGFLNRLRRLSIQHSHLSGEIPVEIAELTSLWILYLDNNEISGRLPDAIGQMTNLEQLGLSGNNLSGVIPQEFVGLVNLRYLGLASNRLTGTFPSWVRNLSNLERLTLGDNQLTGDLSLISEDLEELAHLKIFSVAGNNFSGCIPESIRNLKVTDLVFSQRNYCEAASEQMPITPSFVKWEIGDDVRATEVRAARLGAQWLFEYAESIGWPIVGHDITVYVMTLEPLIYAAAIEDGTIDHGELERVRETVFTHSGFAHADSNFNKATEEGDSVYSPYHLASVVIHENIHTAFQYDINGLRTSPSLNLQGEDLGPAWYVEGMASYFDQLITSLHGGPDFRCRDCKRQVDGEWVTASEIHLSSAEDRDTCEYICGALAIELLASVVGQRHIVDFYTMRRPGQSWQQTFEEAFGISVPDFYAMYDQHREAGFPELNPPIVPDAGR